MLRHLATRNPGFQGNYYTGKVRTPKCKHCLGNIYDVHFLFLCPAGCNNYDADDDDDNNNKKITIIKITIVLIIIILIIIIIKMKPARGPQTMFCLEVQYSTYSKIMCLIVYFTDGSPNSACT